MRVSSLAIFVLSLLIAFCFSIMQIIQGIALAFSGYEIALIVMLFPLGVILYLLQLIFPLPSFNSLIGIYILNLFLETAIVFFFLRKWKFSYSKSADTFFILFAVLVAGMWTAIYYWTGGPFYAYWYYKHGQDVALSLSGDLGIFVEIPPYFGGLLLIILIILLVKSVPVLKEKEDLMSKAKMTQDTQGPTHFSQKKLHNSKFLTFCIGVVVFLFFLVPLAFAYLRTEQTYEKNCSAYAICELPPTICEDLCF